MSIWSSLHDPKIRGYVCDYNPDPDQMTMVVDVATTSFHRCIRLTTWNEAGCDDEDVMLAPDAARALAARLIRAAEIQEARFGG